MLIEDLMRKLTEVHMRDPEATVCLTLKRSVHGGWETYMRITDERVGTIHEEVRMPADYFDLYSAQDMDNVSLRAEIRGMERMREALQPSTRLHSQVSPAYPSVGTAYADKSAGSFTIGTGVTTATIKGNSF